jgi:hypothetical protein
MDADRRAPLVGALAMSFLVGGCIGGTSLEIGTPVNLHVWTTPISVEVDAPGWFADVSRVYLCPKAPPQLPDGAREREGWTPGPGCQDFGSFRTEDGLETSLPLRAIDPDRRKAFDAAPDWYLLILDLDGTRVASSVRSQFHAPPGGVPS